MSRPRTVAEGWVPRKHGIPSSYNRGCRCVECTAENTRRCLASGATERLRKRRYAARVPVGARLVSVDPKARHGERETYNRFGCRCEPCTGAQAVFIAEWRRKRGAA